MVRARLNVEHLNYQHKLELALPHGRTIRLHDYLIGLLHQWSIPVLRVALGLIFLWFGVLKLFGTSPVTTILKQTFPFMPVLPFAFGLGIWEVMIGCGLIIKRALRLTLVLLCFHLTGTFISFLLAPSLFFQHGSPLWLTVEGEFVAKNMVLMAAGLVIGGYEVSPVGASHTHFSSDPDGEHDGALVYLKDRPRRR